MGDPSKVFLFGSFTEDETKSLLNKVSFVAKNSDEGNEIEANSSKKIPELTFGSFSSTSNIQDGSPNGPVCSHPTKVQKGNEQLPSTPSSNHFPIVTDNGKTADSDHGRDVRNQARSSGTNFPALYGLNDESKSSKKSSSELQDFDGVKFSDSTNNSSVKAHNEVALHKADDPPLAARDVLPRGLINSGNLCFLNATLQALLSCSPFILLLQGLRNQKFPKVGYPTLTAFAEFIAEFDCPGGTNIKKKDTNVLETGRAFSPIMFEAVLKNFSPDVPSSISGRPRQEDAQEFLTFCLHQMHDELLKFEGQTQSDGQKPSLVSISEDDEWETVGPKNTSAVTRTQNFNPSELSKIFGGQLRSVVKAKGNKASATVQPFLLLHLDISHESIQTIEDALHSFSAPETLEEYRASSTGKAGVVAARKSVKIQSLPKIVILHLMRFSYDSRGSTKLHKPVYFPLELVLSRDLLVSAASEGRKYELVSSITHHGREASKGHYTADVRHPNNQWLRFDDASVTAINTSKVLHDQAYVLFYKQL
ncbi:ubiquitin carboxyl-terminal hydrolase 24 [Henckelia pumila]|uniref:ubiquitin carboxyl-terminal hydrolase 24 n=1 Tax=Henckelia pumila TaxID=405737 RepID=UPI003C6E04F6